MEIIDKITLKGMEAMVPRRLYTFRFEKPENFAAGLRHAHWVRARHPRKDGMRYTISSNIHQLTIAIKVDTP